MTCRPAHEPALDAVAAELTASIRDLAGACATTVDVGRAAMLLTLDAFFWHTASLQTSTERWLRRKVGSVLCAVKVVDID